MKTLGKLRRKGLSVQAWLLLAVFVAVFLFALLMPLAAFGLTQEEETLREAFVQGEVLRLHILAEDDSTEAQVIKLAVRDAVLAAAGQRLAQAGAQDADTAYAVLCREKDRMLAAAAQTAYACGFRGSVKAETGLLTLPEKWYGNVLLPKGEYRALRITLGSGRGQNWWCVLFPQLCLALAGEEPWQQPLPKEPEWQWHSLRIWQHWPLLAPVQPGQGASTGRCM